MARMPRRFHKHKLLLDEGFLLRQRLPILNSRFDVKHITADLGFVGLNDDKVYQLGIKLKRIVVTFNDKDFRKLTNKNNAIGIIGVSANLNADQIDKKITAILVKLKKKDLIGKFIYISHETKK